MAKNTYDKDFEEFWKNNEQWLVNVAPPLLREERKNNGKMNTTGDWLLFIVPLFVGIGFMNMQFIKSEMLNLILGLVIVVLCYGLSMVIRPFITGKRSITDIDTDIKDFFYGVYQEKGIKGLQSLR